jgi:hypothetical protein
MIISVVNRTNGKVTDEQLQPVIRAINRQIAQDFQPYWSFGAVLRLDGSPGGKPDEQAVPDMRGDAILYLLDQVPKDNILGFHDRNNRGIPYGFVFLDISAKLDEDWTVTLSHEALELIADPETNLLVAGPHPEQPNRDVFFWYEMCDAVQTETYKIDDVNVSNFLLPLYFTGSGEANGRTDFLSRPDANGQTLKAYGVKPGGYIGFFDPVLDKDDTYPKAGDQKAIERFNIKKLTGQVRRATRYQRFRVERAEVAPATDTRFAAGTFSGTLVINAGFSFLQADGTQKLMLTRNDPPGGSLQQRIGAATSFFLDVQHLSSGDPITVTGEMAQLGQQTVLVLG